MLGLTFPAARRCCRATAHAGRSGPLLAVNTIGAIIGSFLVPFLLIPWLGSPHASALLALVNVALGAVIALASRRPRSRALDEPSVAAVLVVIVVVAPWRPARSAAQRGRARLEFGADIFATTEDEIATVQAGQLRSTPELWVAGTSMTLLTVDAKLMPVLPLIARPDSKRALVVAFGMGTAFRSALIAGLKTDVIELVPSVPKMFHFYHPDADAVLADPNGKVIITDGRNHLELADERFDIIVTDPPPPIESSGASVISSREYYEAGRDHLTGRV